MNLQVTVKGDKALITALESIAASLAALTGGTVTNLELPEDTPDEKPAPKKTAAKKEKPAKEEAPADDEPAEEASMTKTEARLALKEYSQLESQGAAVSLLKKHGAASFSLLEDAAFPAFVKDLEKALKTAKADEDEAPTEDSSSFLD